jgi:hypothetical protein
MLEDMQVRNLTFRTQTTYVRQVSLFARHFGKSPEILMAVVTTSVGLIYSWIVSHTATGYLTLNR